MKLSTSTIGITSLLLGFTTNVVAEEIELAEIHIQRRDPIEYAWGEANDQDELTWAENADGTVSLYVGTDEGSKYITDPDALHIVQPVVLSEDQFVVYHEIPSTPDEPILLLDKNVYSLWNYVSGSTTNYVWPETIGAIPRKLHVRSLNPSMQIIKVDCTITDAPVPNTILPKNRVQTVMEDETEGLASEHVLLFSATYTAGSNNYPPSCTVSNFVVYAIQGNNLNSEIDARVVDITVKEQDGREYSLGRMHHMIETIHAVQDRWSYYKADHNVQLNNKTLWLDTEKFSCIESDGDLGGSISSDTGPLISWDRGTDTSARIIRDIKVTDTSVKIYVSKKFGDNFSVLGAATLDATYEPISFVNNGEVEINDTSAYELEVPYAAEAQGFYKVVAHVDDAHSRPASVTIHPDVLKFGSDEEELHLIDITIGTTTFRVIGREL